MARQQLAAAGVRLLTFAVVGGLLFTTALVVRGDAATPAVRAGGLTLADDPEALRLLARANTAERRVAYLGRQFVSVRSRGGTARHLVELENIPGSGLVVEARGGSTTHAGLVSERTQPETDRAPLRADGRTLLDRSYTLALAGTGRSVGRRTGIVEAVRADGTPAARFWIDSRTGLLLRRELYDTGGELTRASGFVELRVGETSFSARLPRSLSSSRSSVVPASSYRELAERGWHCCRPALAGPFRLTEVRRSGRSLQLSYSDGLASASVFQRRGRLDPSALAGFETERVGDGEVHARYGLTSVAVWSSGGLVYTVVADTPDSLRTVVSRLPHGAPPPEAEDGLGHRLDRGMNRMVSWLTEPFE